MTDDHNPFGKQDFKGESIAEYLGLTEDEADLLALGELRAREYNLVRGR